MEFRMGGELVEKLRLEMCAKITFGKLHK